MVLSVEHEEQSDNDSLSDIQYEHLLARYKELIDVNEAGDCTNDETNYMTIKSDPVVLNVPEDISDDEPQAKFPYLRRGAGLARFNMTPDQLKQGQPEFFKKRQFKSYQKCIVKPPKEKTRETVKPVKEHPARKFATSVSKAFDDEIIPTLRNKTPTSESFDVPIPKNLLVRRVYVPKIPDVPKTPLKKLILRQGIASLPQNDSECANSNNNYDDTSDVSDDEDSNRSVNRRLCYDVNQSFQPKRGTEYTGPAASAGNVKDSENSEIVRKTIRKQQQVSQPEPDVRTLNSYQIAEAMKRKGLTDNVKKHLGWNTPPKKRRPFSIVKKIKIKKAKPVKEKLNLHELKDRLNQLEDVKNKLQLENNRIKRIEKDYGDEKLKLDKQRRELENMLKEERERIAEERLKLMEDVKKFKRDKTAFEKFCAETRNLPTRDEREEIRGLKEELEKLKDAQKTKDARVGALQAQLRNRIAVLEKENAVLKEDLEIAKKVSLKKVRFESEGKIRAKMIDAINTQLASKLKEPVASSVKQMRRTKSASDVKPVGNLVEDISDEEVSPEIVELKDDGDSGVGSRPSSSDSLSNSMPQTESIEAIKKRLEKVLAESQEKCMPMLTKNILDEKTQNIYTVAYQDFQECDKRKMLDVTDDFSAAPIRTQKTQQTICSRHGALARESSRLSLGFLDRDVIRTELSGGDVEEEELRTGVRRLWCGTCGTCEVTYRNRLGYRRTTTPEGNTLEEHPDGLRECRYRSGEIVRKYANGDKEVLFPNGDREFTTKGYKKLERPDGIVKTVFEDGRQETRYPSGRVRLKDKNGLLVMDTGGFM